MPAKSQADEILTVTQLSARLKGVMEENFPSVWVAG